MTTRYVAGFLFNKGATQVVVVEKQRPAWQAGRFNAVGGHIEDGESAMIAMIREFCEETGLLIDTWQRFCVLRGSVVSNHTELEADHCSRGSNDWEVHFFVARTSLEKMRMAGTKTDEMIAVLPVRDISCHNAIPNLPWLMAMARDMGNDLHRRVSEYIINEQYMEDAHASS